MPGRNTTPTFFEYGGSPPVILPTITLTAPVANPCNPRATISVTYAYTGTGGTAVCVLSIFVNGNVERSALVYNGNPSTNLPAISSPSGYFEVVSHTDNGTTGTIVLRPITGKYWPINIATWTGVITTDIGSSASSIGTQTVDATLIPPLGDVVDPVVSGQSPAPGSVINPNTAVTFNVTDNVALRTVFVFVAFAGTDAREVVHDGTSFTPNYAGASTRTGTSANYAYTCRRFGGWPASPTFVALPIDTSGNQP